MSEVADPNVTPTTMDDHRQLHSSCPDYVEVAPARSLPESLLVTRWSACPAHWQLLDERAVACSDDHMRFDIKTKASPEQVLRALTDFTDARLQIWSRTLDPKTYELRDSGQTWAVARESSPRSPFWVVVRYDWSDPESVRWTVLEK